MCIYFKKLTEQAGIAQRLSMYMNYCICLLYNRLLVCVKSKYIDNCIKVGLIRHINRLKNLNFVYNFAVRNLNYYKNFFLQNLGLKFATFSKTHGKNVLQTCNTIHLNLILFLCTYFTVSKLTNLNF